MFNVILKVAAGAALTAVAQYAAKASVEKLAREPAFVKAQQTKAARELANLLIDIDARGVETKLHMETWELHKAGKTAGCEDCTTAMVVETREKPHVGFYQTRMLKNQTILIVDGCEVATYHTSDFRRVMEKAIENHTLIVGYNMKG